MESFNQAFFLALNADPDTPLWAIDLGRLIAKRVILIIPFLLTAMWLWGYGSHRSAALRALVTTAIALGINHALGLVMPIDRPFVVGLGHTYLAHAPTPSFPSNHLTIFMCVALCTLRPKRIGTGITLIIVGMVVAWSRIFVGVHYPLDMAGAIATAFLAYGLLTPLWKRWGQPATTGCIRLYRRVLAVPIAAGWLRY